MVERAAAAPSVRFSYGSIAFPLPGRRAAPEHTHRWSVFVRGADNGDLTHAVSRVVFTLHESFAQPVRGACPRAAVEPPRRLPGSDEKGDSSRARLKPASLYL